MYTVISYRCGLLFFLLAFLSCTNVQRNKTDKDRSKDEGNITDSITHALFLNQNKTYGFDIIVNGKTFIHQPIIPTWQGIQYFSSAEAASKVAFLMVKKLRFANYKFLLQKFEIDSLIGANENVLNSLEKVSVNASQPTAINPIYSGGGSDKFFSQKVPDLPNPPIKNKWTVKGVVPFGYRAGCFGFAIAPVIYIGSGALKDEHINDFWGYNIITEAWTCFADVPQNIFAGIAFTVHNKGYVALGSQVGISSGKSEKNLYQYNSDLNTWLVKKDFPGKGRIDASTFVIGEKVYAGTGFAGDNLKDFYEYDPKKDTWKQIADFEGGDVHASVGIGTGGKGFIVAGNNKIIDHEFLYEYLPITDKWVKRKSLPGKGRTFLSGDYIDSNLLLAGAGGAEGGGFRFRDFFIYDTEKDIWQKAQNYPSYKSGSTRAVGGNVAGKIYMGTGFGAGHMNDWNMYEYYFSIRKDTGLYNETVCYPLKWNGSWELYQECIKEDCFAGVQIKSVENLGNFCYNSYFGEPKNLQIEDIIGIKKSMFIFSRSYSIQTEKQPAKSVSIQLFFSREEIEKSLKECNTQKGNHYLIKDIFVLQYNDKDADTYPFNNNFEQKKYSLIHPRWYQYGYNAQTLVAEISVSQLSSEFYLTLPGK
jgi:hypothetical protein